MQKLLTNSESVTIGNLSITFKLRPTERQPHVGGDNGYCIIYVGGRTPKEPSKHVQKNVEIGISTHM